MRIGRTIINTDDMSISECTDLINALIAIQHRKLQAADLRERMMTLLTEAKENGFSFIDKDFGQVWTPQDVTVYDER